MEEEGPLAVKTGCGSDRITAAYRAESHALALLCDQTDNTTSLRPSVNKDICLNWKMKCNTAMPNPADLFSTQIFWFRLSRCSDLFMGRNRRRAGSSLPVPLLPHLFNLLAQGRDRRCCHVPLHRSLKLE